MYPYRVFVSYAHEDKDLVDPLVKVLEHEFKVTPVIDQHFAGGAPFSEKIRDGISHAHIFLPVMTKTYVGHPWVHHEAGYAIAMRIPVVPVAVKPVPFEMEPPAMLRDLQAVVYDPDLGLSASFVRKLGTAIKTRSQHVLGLSPNVTLARYPEVRTQLLADLTHEAIAEGAYDCLRQRGAFSSFCLPREGPAHKVWRERDGRVVRNEYMYLLLGWERRALDAYAAEHGANLILNPSQPLRRYGTKARRVRLGELLKYLNDLRSREVKNVRVVIDKRNGPSNLTIVGDWFSAVSYTPSAGYEDTVFTWHAPTVLRQINDFDDEFKALFGKASPEGSIESAAQQVQKELAAIPTDAP